MDKNVDELCDKFSKTIDFIGPNEIPIELQNKSFHNMKKNNPYIQAKKEEKKNKIINSINSSKSNKSSNKIIPNNINESKNIINNSNLNIQSNSLSESQAEKTSNTEMSDNQKIKDRRFGQHSSFSFFECFVREIIFQIFNYHKMFFFGYELKKEDVFEDERLNKLIQKQINAKKNREKNKIQDNKEENNNINKPTINEKTEDKPKDKKINEVKKQKSSEENSDTQNKISCSANPIINLSDELRKEFEKKGSIKGDIDFLLPDVTPEELEKVLKNKELSPFIFYGNINLNKNSDLIGEVKETIDNGDEAHIRQFKKYLKILKLSQSNETIKNKIGVTKDNQKIFVYVFNSDYNSYLKRMLLYDNHLKKFEERNTSIEAKTLIAFYSQFSRKQFGEKFENYKFDLIREIVHSNYPYIFIFIQDLVKFYEIVKTKKLKIDNQMNANLIVNPIINSMNKMYNLLYIILIILIVVLAFLFLIIFFLFYYFFYKLN